jgi:hypothetical protein
MAGRECGAERGSEYVAVTNQMNRLIAITLFATTLAGCSGASSPTVAPNVTAQQGASAGRSMGLSFPPETRFLLYHRASEGGLPAPDDAVHLKIELPASSLATLLSQSPLLSAKWTSSRPLITDVPKWTEWKPSKIKNFRCEQFQLPNGQALNMLIDDDRDDTKVVYFFWFET